MISIIAAMDINGVIGKDGKLPWNIPEDLRYFKQMTVGLPIVMGRKTYESIGRLLPGRENRIVTRQVGYKIPGAKVYNSVQDACQGEGEIFVIGGAEIYKECLPFADKLYLTMIDEDFEGDTYFPEWDQSQFTETQGISYHDGQYLMSFVILERKVKTLTPEQAAQEIDRLTKSLDIADKVIDRLTRELNASNEANVKWHEKYKETKDNLKTAVGYLMQAKAKFAPETTNSLVDDFLEKFKDLK